MARLKFTFLFMSCFLFGFLGENPSSALVQEECVVEISSPQPGENVGISDTITGEATIPSNNYLWLISKRKDFVGNWWPQGAHETPVNSDGTFEGLVHFGNYIDIGHQFIVRAIVVNEATNRDLTQWARTAHSTGYQPIALPNIVDACITSEIIVEKVDH